MGVGGRVQAGGAVIISATRVRRSREWRECCQCSKVIHQGEACVSLYGAAHRSDKPFRIWAHECCLSEGAREALAKDSARRIDRAVARSVAIAKQVAV